MNKDRLKEEREPIGKEGKEVTERREKKEGREVGLRFHGSKGSKTQKKKERH